MSVPTATNGILSLTVEERDLVDQIRKLPPQAIPQIEEFLSLLTARLVNPIALADATPAQAAAALASEGFQKIVRSLPPAAAELILELATFYAGRHLRWSYDDPASLELSAELMALDPFLRRVNDEINQDFSVCDADGLENNE